MKKGKDIHGGWEKGARLRRWLGQAYWRDGVLLDDGRYFADDHRGLWYFKIRWSDGSEAIIVPQTNDEIINTKNIQKY